MRTLAAALPSPLWGGTGVGVGTRFTIGGKARLDPHPLPLPARGRGIACLVALALALFVSLAPSARAEPDYPAFTGLVVDDARILTPWDQADLSRKLQDLQDKTGVQFAVATVSSLGGDEIEPYANALFRKWRVGQKGADNGLLLVLAPNERKLRFEVGYGLEGTMTDVQSKLILRNDMVPKLKGGDPAGALKAGVDDAILVLTKDKADLPTRLKPDEGGPSPAFYVLAFIILIVFIYLTIKGGGLRFSTGFTSGAVIGSSTGNDRSGDSASSGSGDSFSGGGGGDSGGGGASDSY